MMVGRTLQNQRRHSKKGEHGPVAGKSLTAREAISEAVFTEMVGNECVMGPRPQ